ncbi:hypothetical protein FKM82_014381 [Ascaphus truei]
MPLYKTLVTSPRLSNVSSTLGFISKRVPSRMEACFGAKKNNWRVHGLHYVLQKDRTKRTSTCLSCKTRIILEESRKRPMTDGKDGGK